MKVYLILVIISLIASHIIRAETKLYRKQNFRVLGVPSFEERLLGWAKWFIMVLLILPYVLALFTCLFDHDTFLETLDETFSESERFERIYKYQE